VAVFTSPVLDNFNRTENPLSTGYLAGPYSDAAVHSGRLKATGSQAQAPATAYASSVWGTSYSDCEVYLTTGVPGSSGQYWLYVRAQNTGTSTATAYGVNLATDASGNWTQVVAGKFGSDGLSLSPSTAYTSTLTAFQGTIPSWFPTSGAVTFGVRCYNLPWGWPLVEAWAKDKTTGIWRRACAWSDNTGSAQLMTGNPAFAIQDTIGSSVDNLGGGSITPPSPVSLTVDIGGGFSGALPDPLSAEIGGGIVVPSTPAFIAARADPLSERIRSTAPNNFFTKDLESTGGGISVSV